MDASQGPAPPACRAGALAATRSPAAMRFACRPNEAAQNSRCSDTTCENGGPSENKGSSPPVREGRKGPPPLLKTVGEERHLLPSEATNITSHFWKCTRDIGFPVI